MDLSSTTGNANPELLWLESVMVSRIDQFKHNKWKPDQTGYHAVYYWLDKKPWVEPFNVTHVAGNGLLETDRYRFRIYPSDVSFDELASIALLYFRLKDMHLPDAPTTLTEKRRQHALKQTKMLFFKLLIQKAKETT